MKKYILVLLTALALMVMTACGTTEKEENAGQEQGNGSSEVVEENDGAVEEEPVEEDTDGEEAVDEEDASTPVTNAEILQDTGAYVGMADPHTIEVNTESSGALALQIGEVEYDFDSIKTNAEVAIKFYKNADGQNVLTEIKVK